MRNKSFGKIIICLLGAVLITSCGNAAGNSPGDRTEKVENSAAETLSEDAGDGAENGETENENESADAEGTVSGSESADTEVTVNGSESEEAAKDGKEEIGIGDKEEAETDVDNSADDSEDSRKDSFFADAFKENQVYNNGNYFVRIRDKVYFRNISTDSLDEGMIFGEFLQNEQELASCPLICYDLNTCSWIETCSIYGVGKLYACPEGFYMEQPDPGRPLNVCTDLFDPVTGDSSFYCSGKPLGVSESGEILAVKQYKDNTGWDISRLVLIKNGEEIASLDSETDNYEYIGFAGNTLITMRFSENDGYTLCSVDENGNITELGLIGNTDNGYAELEQFGFIRGDIYVCLGYYEGSGHFLNAWKIIKATPGEKGSIETIRDCNDVYSNNEGEESDPTVPEFFIDDKGNLDCADHIRYEAFMGKGEKANDLLYYNDAYDECLIVKDFIDTSDYSNCSIIQDMESIAETAFVIYADAKEDSKYDIGWRTGYCRTGWHICAVPFGEEKADNNGSSDSIIYFQDISEDGSQAADENGNAEDQNKTGDPLEGLVSNDILSMYRETNPVAKPDSIEDEAYGLGAWVQKNMPSVPKNIKEKGTSIGNRYEFWFGTDIGNNFDSNFAYIYAAYYSLKDYYTSDGKSSKEFYEKVAEENEYLGSGNPEAIENMYQDMRDFITDCNNYIRDKEG